MKLPEQRKHDCDESNTQIAPRKLCPLKNFLTDLVPKNKKLCLGTQFKS